jgi:hypothetical protein
MIARNIALASIGVMVTALALTAMTQAPNTLTADEKAAGWQLLFDGKSLEHWRGFKQEGVSEGWQVVDDTFVRVSRAGDLITRAQYTSFELALEWKVPPGGNSGVMFHVVEELERTYHSGPEMQIHDNGGHRDGRNPLTSAGSNYALHAPPSDITKPVGEWNTARLVVNGTHVEHWLNGEKVVEYELGTPEWIEKVAASKFNEWPRYGKAGRGHIAIQDHDSAVAFRNVKIRVIR